MEQNTYQGKMKNTDFLFLFLFESTQLARQLHQEHTQMVVQ